MPPIDRSRRGFLIGGGSALLAGLAGCTSGGGGSATTDAGTESTDTMTTSSPSTTQRGEQAWRRTELTDVTTGNTFTVEQFAGKPVLLEFFAVWCPICTDQQEQVAALLNEMDDLVAISLNVDPNEDAERVREYVEKHGFDWRFAVAPSSMTKALIDQFGSVITTPPAAPVVRICPGGAAKLVEGGGSAVRPTGAKTSKTLRGSFTSC